jgi:hypothetical protein
MRCAENKGLEGQEAGFSGRGLGSLQEQPVQITPVPE